MVKSRITPCFVEPLKPHYHRSGFWGHAIFKSAEGDLQLSVKQRYVNPLARKMTLRETRRSAFTTK